MRTKVILFFLCLSALTCFAQQPVRIHVDANQTIAPFQPIWRYFGYDEPNYTYGKNGKKLVGELSSLSSQPVMLRAHNLLTTGDGTPALKWGSTNVYTLDAAGKPVYSWTILDRILDTYVKAGARPFFEIGFMPKALSTHPNPYRHNFPKGPIDTGWSYPPTSYQKWSDLVYHVVRHAVERYGAAEVKTWDWEVWNEPNILYWHGDASAAKEQSYDKLYDYTAAAVKRALPEARVGGPATTGPAWKPAGEFLRQFLEHCASGKNYVTGKTGTPLDFITYHAKGANRFVDGHVQMGIARQLNDVDDGLKIISAFPQFRRLPVVLSESDPEGCAACVATTHPQNGYRHSPLYASYTAVMMDSILKLNRREHGNIVGMLTWAFEYDGQPWFAGYRTLATHGVDKPILNFFRMAGLMHGDQVRVNSTGALPIETMMKQGVRQQPDIDALAVRSAHEVSVLVWNYDDEDMPAPAADIALSVAGVPATAKRVLVRQYRIDQEHSDSYTVWKQMGSPQQPTAEQKAQLEQAGQLQMLDSPEWVSSHAGSVRMKLSLPRQALSLVQVSW